MEAGAFFSDGGMILVAVLIAVDGTGGRGKVLNQCTSQTYINDLHSSADSQHRHGPAYSKLQRLQLQDIQLGIYISGTVILFAEKGWGDVSAAGQDQPVAVGDLPHTQGGDRLQRGGFHIVHIISGIGGLADNCDFHSSLFPFPKQYSC